MQEHVEGLHGVEVIADDFVVVGFGSTPEEWNADHDRNVRAFLERCQEKNLKLKKEKAQLRKTEVAFIGHILTPDGLKPDPKKVEAINDMPRSSYRCAVSTKVPGYGNLPSQVFAMSL
jgi:hypothetical protein